MKSALVNFKNFIIATRDSGYKNSASALAELVDNSIEAGAKSVEISIYRTGKIEDQYEVMILDDGCGMNELELNLALQFGGSTRFNSRDQLGRYGMGLPNSSLSQCRHVEVITWKQKQVVLMSHLDVDEVIDKNLNTLPRPIKLSHWDGPIRTDTGTAVKWKKCDRLSFKYLKTLVKHIHFELGRIFRYSLWNGVTIVVCGEKVKPFDPLFIKSGWNLRGAQYYGDVLKFVVKIPGEADKTSLVTVKFVELPVEEWAKMSNDEKRKNQITKRAGVTILRAGREIDYGWFFMGEKRKENYDDWWRCEIMFDPELDEVFGVTHTKQEINQTEFIDAILVPDLEQIARTLNNRVRLKFLELKKNQPTTFSKTRLERNDLYLPPLNKQNNLNIPKTKSNQIAGSSYKIEIRELRPELFFAVEESADTIILIINSIHIFHDKVFKVLHSRGVKKSAEFVKMMEIVLFAAARSEFSFLGKRESKVISNFKKEWSLQLKTLIS